MIIQAISHLIILSILLISLFFTNDYAKDYSYILYLFQLIIFSLILYRKKYFLFFLSPIIILIFYVDLSFLIGNWAFSNKLVSFPTYLKSFQFEWAHHNYLVFYILLSNTILFYIDAYFRKFYKTIINNISTFIPNDYHIYVIITSTIFFIFFLYFQFDASIFGGSGDMSFVPKAIASINIFYFLSKKRIPFRFLFYLAIIVLFSTFSFQSKREAIFLIMPILLLEAVLNNYKINFKRLFFLFLTFLILIILIIAMSILRGYGEFDIIENNLFSTFPFIFEYINNPLFLIYFFNNIETNYTYFHSYNAMEYIFRDIDLLSLGSTIIKFLFIPFPRSYFGFIKPDSIISEYMNTFSSSIREAGGSMPPNVYAEMFWNFHFIGIFASIIIFSLFMLIFLKLIKWIKYENGYKYSWCLFAFSQFLTYVRGSGLDMYFVYVIFGYFISWSIYNISMLFVRHRYNNYNLQIF